MYKKTFVCLNFSKITLTADRPEWYVPKIYITDEESTIVTSPKYSLTILVFFNPVTALQAVINGSDILDLRMFQIWLHQYLQHQSMEKTLKTQLA